MALIEGLLNAGLPSVEVASFVSPKAVPKMAGAADVVGALDLDRADFHALVPNRKGYELASASGIRSVGVVLSATETMNRENINMSLDRATSVCAEVLQQARTDGLKARAYVSVAFECPFEGVVPDERLERLGAVMFDAGADEVIVADTIGAGNPLRAKALFGRMVAAFGASRLAAHLHDTRALALANAWQALECGIRRFDSSVGGLGGCPFAAGAAGNLATQDLRIGEITREVRQIFESLRNPNFATPFLGRKLGKKRGAIVGILVTILLYPVPFVLLLMGWLPALGSWTSLYVFAALSALEVVGVMSGGVLLDSMMADVVEDSEIETKRLGAGTIVSLVRLDGIESVDLMTRELWEDLASMFLPLFCGLNLLALLVVLRYPITRDGHSANLPALAGRRRDAEPA